ncbi:eukaryotic translation initiation factor 2-alpha kinase 3-like [Saccoglossus kowalevskii]
MGKRRRKGWALKWSSFFASIALMALMRPVNGDGGGDATSPSSTNAAAEDDTGCEDDTLYSHSKHTRYYCHTTVVYVQDYFTMTQHGTIQLAVLDILLYICSADGCEQFGESKEEDEDDIILIKREQQTVRSVEQRTGGEKWNFSVGQHDITFLKSRQSNKNRNDDFVYCEDESECLIDDEEDYFFSDDEDYRLNPDLKFAVSDGSIAAVSRQNAQKVLWKHKLSSPIASAWSLEDGDVMNVNLFEANTIPALSMGAEKNPVNDVLDFMQPVLYMGMYHEQCYIQQSNSKNRAVPKATQSVPSLDASDTMRLLAGPKVLWRPYIASAPSRTPIMITQVPKGGEDGDSKALATWSQYPYGMYHEQCYIQQSHSKNRAVPKTTQSVPSLDASDTMRLLAGPKVLWRPYIASAPSRTPIMITQVPKGGEDGDSKALATWSQYPYDSGYYLFADQTPVKLVTDRRGNKRPYLVITEGNNESMDGYSLNTLVAVSVWDWWKEILQLCILMSMLVSSIKKSLVHNNGNIPQTVESGDKDMSKPTQSNDPKEFKSRYHEDFEQLYCLGKGGFGTVFEARNKLDDNTYAIKRISLPDREEARQKVMREVKALAKLEHHNIVRYFQAWLESPPVEWKDYHNCAIPTVDDKNDIAPFGGGEEALSNYINVNSAGESEGFLPMMVPDDDKEESGSWSVDYHGYHDEHHQINVEKSFSLDFRDDDFDTNDSASKALPFKNYVKEESDSFNVIFEDSGCGDKMSERTNTNSAHSSSLSRVVSEKLDLNQTTAEEHDQQENEESADGHKLYLYIQMQLCQKESLKDWLQTHNGPRDHQQVLYIFEQTISAVQYVHECAMIHRDLKPSNIFFSLDGSIKIGDFGLVTAMEVQPASGEELPVAPEKKHTDQVGTQLYMSPEQIAGKSYGHKVDIFSLGLIFFELMHPFSTQMERIQVMMSAKRQIFPEDFRRQSSEEAQFAEWLLSAEADKRPSADEIVESELYRNVYRDYIAPKTPRKRNTSSCSD